MPAARKKTFAPVKPANFQAIAQDLGLRVVCYLHEAVECDDGERRWLPRDLVGEDGKSLIVYRVADREYAIDGWCPWHDGMFGGRYKSISQALHWIETAKSVRAGTIKNFLGA